MKRWSLPVELPPMTASLEGWMATTLATLSSSSPLNWPVIVSFPPSVDHNSICLGFSIDPTARTFFLLGCQHTRKGVNHLFVLLLCFTCAHGIIVAPAPSLLYNLILSSNDKVTTCLPSGENSEEVRERVAATSQPPRSSVMCSNRWNLLAVDLRS